MVKNRRFVKAGVRSWLPIISRVAHKPSQIFDTLVPKSLPCVPLALSWVNDIRSAILSEVLQSRANPLERYCRRLMSRFLRKNKPGIPRRNLQPPGGDNPGKRGVESLAMGPG